MRNFAIAAAIAGSFALAPPAAAEVVSSSETGFVVQLSTEVAAPPAEAWRTLVTPLLWWDGRHTWPGDAANLYIDSQATGCFCEKLPGKIEGQRPGSVEHMRIIHADPGRMLRMSGGLGPLQGEAVTGTLTMTLKPVEGGTRILWEYVVGGFMRTEVAKMAPLVDKVMAEQIERLAAKIGPLAPPAEALAGQAGEDPAPAPR